MWKQTSFYHKYQIMKKNFLNEKDCFPLVITDTYEGLTRYSGISKPGEQLTKSKAIFSKIYYFGLITHWLSIILALFESRDFAIMGELAILIAAIGFIIVFSLNFTRNGHSIFALINEIIELNRRERNNEKFVQYLFSNYVQDVILYYLGAIFGCILSSSFFISPLVKQEWILPMRSKLSCFIHNSFTLDYVLAYVYQCFVIWTMVYVVVLTGHCSGGIVKMISLHFECLADKFRRLNYEGSNFCLYDLIKQHQHLLKLMDDYHDRFGVALITQVVTSMFLICLSLFEVFIAMNNHQKEVLYSFTMFWICATIQLAYWCWLGNKINYQSYEIRNAALAGNWTTLSKELKRDLLLVVARAQQPVSLKAPRLFVFNHETFVSVMKGSYSFFTMLTSVNERP